MNPTVMWISRTIMALAVVLMISSASGLVHRSIETMHGGIGSAFLAAEDMILILIWLDTFEDLRLRLKEARDEGY